jgi:hypothetical protein
VTFAEVHRSMRKENLHNDEFRRFIGVIVRVPATRVSPNFPRNLVVISVSS